MTRFKENSVALLERLGQELGKRGFKAVKEEQDFVRKYANGRKDVLHVGFVRHADTDFDVLLDCGLRIDAVEKLIGELTGADTDTTIGVEIGNLIDGKQRRWTVAEAADVEPVVAQLMQAIETTLLPYFERNSDLKQALAALRDPQTGHRHSPFDGRRFIRTLALAELVGDRPAVEAIVAEGRATLAKRNPENAARFEEFAQRILDRT